MNVIRRPSPRRDPVGVEVEDDSSGAAWMPVALADLSDTGRRLLANGARFVSVFVAETPDRSLVVLLAINGGLLALRSPLPPEAQSYVALGRHSPAAVLPERELHDVEGVTPIGHPRLEPLVDPDANAFRRFVSGEEAFVIPYGPIRSGIFETIQYGIDTGGEDVLAVDVRPFFKRRSLERRFEGLDCVSAVALAERISAPASVAHAVAFTEAVERVAGFEAPAAVQSWRVVHAELERIAGHLDVATRLAEDAALSVAIARFGILKEDVMRLRARIGGSRFGRGAVVPGGEGTRSAVTTAELFAALDAFERDFERDRRLFVGTASETDRLIGSGALDAATVDAYGGVGPVARASALAVDARFERPYGGYRRLGLRIASETAGDAMARLQVRFQEIGSSLHLIRQALRPRRRDGDGGDVFDRYAGGAGFGWAEAPMGEVVYWVELEGGLVRRVHVVSPSLRNWPLFAESFRGDVLTDFSFIEHSFGLSPAGSDR